MDLHIIIPLVAGCLFLAIAYRLYQNNKYENDLVAAMAYAMVWISPIVTMGVSILCDRYIPSPTVYQVVGDKETFVVERYERSGGGISFDCGKETFHLSNIRTSKVPRLPKLANARYCFG